MKIYVLYTWFSGEEKTFEVFTNAHIAKDTALTYAVELWGKHHEDDWPAMPDSWECIYQEVLNRAGESGDEIVITEHTLISTNFVINLANTDDGIVVETMTQASSYIEDLIQDGETSDNITLLESFPKDFEVAPKAKVIIK
jgi:hypothetical protein